MILLILVLSCRHPPYNALFAAQKQTWDAIAVSNVSTRYYFGNYPELQMLWKLKLALDEVWSESWTHLFRTNASSYVDKTRLLDVARALPQTKCYFGLDGGGFASGSGMLLSRDVAEVLHETIPFADDVLIEDEAIGKILAAKGIAITPGARRYDFFYQEFLTTFFKKPQDDLRDHYHIRCKHDSNRMKDVEAMETVHRIKMEPR